MSRRIVTIDGPAGAGKGTVAKIVGKTLGLIQLDSGALYRLITVHFLKVFNNELPTNQDHIVVELKNVHVDMQIEEKRIKWILNGKLVGAEIRDPKVSLATSDFSKFIPVREKVNILLRELSISHDIIIDGRDTGSVVFPHADLKIYLDASPEIRAQRRMEQLMQSGKIGNLTYEQILQDTIIRDTNDKSKAFGALKVPENACIIDSSHMTIEDTAQKIIDLYHTKVHS
ncbi:MAG: (d)CMP kinase [Candidatus Gracilibacteria bacterium]